MQQRFREGKHGSRLHLLHGRGHSVADARQATPFLMSVGTRTCCDHMPARLQSSAQDQRSRRTPGGGGWSNCPGQAAVHSTAARPDAAGGSITQPSPPAQLPTHHWKAASLKQNTLRLIWG
jgi:hypothetical protein